jgi:hypothetical protein
MCELQIGGKTCYICQFCSSTRFLPLRNCVLLMSSLDEQRSGALKLVTSLSLSLSLSFHFHVKSKTSPAQLHGSPWCWRSQSRRRLDTNGWGSLPHSWLCRFYVMVAVVCSCVPALHDKICNSTLAILHYFCLIRSSHIAQSLVCWLQYTAHIVIQKCVLFIVLLTRYTFATFEVCSTTKLYICPGFLGCLCYYCWQGKIQSWRNVAPYIYTYKSRKTEVHTILFHHIFLNYKNIAYAIKSDWTIWCTTRT